MVLLWSMHLTAQAASFHQLSPRAMSSYSTETSRTEMAAAAGDGVGAVGWTWLNFLQFFHSMLHCSIGCHWSLVSFSYPQRYQERRCADCWKSWRRLVSCFDRQDLSMPLHGHVDLTVSAMCHQGANTSEEHVSSTLPSNLFVFKWVWELNGMYKATNPFYLRLWQNWGIFDRFADVSIWKDCLSASNSRAA